MNCAGIPCHPAIVHLPIGFSILFPFAALLVFFLIRKGALPARAWYAAVVLQALVALGAFAATRTGHADEEIVERVVPETVIEEHEEAGERFFQLSLVLLAVTVAGAVSPKGRTALQLGAAALGFAAIASAAYTGHLGGKLVYEHGAAGAFTQKSGASAAGAAGSDGAEGAQHDEASHSHD